MPEGLVFDLLPVAAVGSLLLALILAGAYRLGVRNGRDRQRVLSSRLGHGPVAAPSALLFDPEGVTTDFKRRDLGGVCPDCDAAPERCSVSGCRSLPAVHEVTR